MESRHANLLPYTRPISTSQRFILRTSPVATFLSPPERRPIDSFPSCCLGRDDDA